MSPDLELNNIASWKQVEASIDEYPENTQWIPWKKLARRFIDASNTLGLSYFRSGMGMHHLLFSTLDHHGLRHEPRVTVVLHPENEMRVAYGTTNLYFFSPEIEYTLPFEPGFATFRRFLNQLWIATMTDPIPDELRRFSAPILTSETRLPTTPT